MPLPSSQLDKNEALHQALANFQSTAANFATMCINDARVRQQYMHDIGKASAELKSANLAGKMTAHDAAITVNRLRNEILELSRLRSSPTSRAYAMKMKKNGLTLESLADTYARRIFRKPFTALSEPQQTSVYAEIVSVAGRANVHVAELAKELGRAGQRLAFVSLAVATYEVYIAEDKPREVARQGILATGGIVGGWAVSGGVVGTGICATTAPLCIGISAFIGGLLFAFGGDLAFDTAYFTPTIQSRP